MINGTTMEISYMNYYFVHTLCLCYMWFIVYLILFNFIFFCVCMSMFNVALNLCVLFLLFFCEYLDMVLCVSSL